MAAALLGFEGLSFVLTVDLLSFLFTFVTLVFIKMPDDHGSNVSVKTLLLSVKEEIAYIKKEKNIISLLMLYSTLEFIGSVSFDGMYSPLILARSGNNEIFVGCRFVRHLL